MKIWIDLTNSPHVTFFSPIIKRLEASGHTVFVTYRDFAQTKSLVEQAHFNATLIDGHGGKSKLGKIKNLLSRTYQLVCFARRKNFDVAVSHNSYFQLAAAKMLGIKSLTSMDFEGQPANHIAFRLASLVSVPEAFPKSELKRFGAKNVYFYRGIKETISLADFSVDCNFEDNLADAFKLTTTDLAKPIVVVRPPPTLALYHNNDDKIFQAVLKKITSLECTVLVVPRTEEQGKEIRSQFTGFFYSQATLDGLQLVAYADVLISGGGSMNREAACLGTEAISVFSGKLCAVDQFLQAENRLIQLTTQKEVDNLVLTKHKNTHYHASNDSISDFINHIYKLI
jgi:predicted glycosyltransferase